MSYIFFWKTDEEYGFLSNWYHSPFIVDGIEYYHTEQYFMAKKASFFGDLVHQKEILASSSPKKCKDLGCLVSPFDPVVWDEFRYGIMMNANLAKFTQNHELRKKLLDTGDSLLAEASPVDGIWGIKLSADEAAKLPPEEWPGLNLMGKILMTLRSDFRSDIFKLTGKTDHQLKIEWLKQVERNFGIINLREHERLLNSIEKSDSGGKEIICKRNFSRSYRVNRKKGKEDKVV
ncbi:MAG: NADAR family protein [Clostridia bacterium]|nr:NADAR family protein [Clostridia bacterium]